MSEIKDFDEYRPSLYESLTQESIDYLGGLTLKPDYDSGIAKTLFKNTSLYHNNLIEMGFEHEDLWFACTSNGIYNLINLLDNEVLKLISMGFDFYEITLLCTNIHHVLWVLHNPDYARLLYRGYSRREIVRAKLCNSVMETLLSISDDDFLEFIRQGKTRNQIFELVHTNTH